MVTRGFRDPRRTDPGQHNLDECFSAYIRRCKSMDPTPRPQQALPSSTILWIAMHLGSSTSKRLRMAANLIILAFFFLLRVGEYTPSRQVRLTVPLRDKDLRLWRQGQVLDHRVPLAELLTADAVTIGLLPIEVPAYLLDNRSIAIASDDSQITFRDFDRWAESLDKGLARILRGALAREATVKQVLVPPFPLQPARDYDLSVRVVDCVGLESGRLRYVLSYALTSPDGSVHRQGTYIWQGMGEGNESAQLARTISAATAAAGREIAAAVTP